MWRPLLWKYELRSFNTIESMIFLFSAFCIIVFTCDAMITKTPASTSKCPNETLVWTWILNNTDNIKSQTWTKDSTILLEYSPIFGIFPFDNRSLYENGSYKLPGLLPDDTGIYSMEVQYGNRPTSKSSVMLKVYDWVRESPSIRQIHRSCQETLLNCSIPDNALDVTIIWMDGSGEHLTTNYSYNATTCGKYTCIMKGGASQCMTENTQLKANFEISDCLCNQTTENGADVSVNDGITTTVVVPVVVTVVTAALIVVAVVAFCKECTKKNSYKNIENNDGTGEGTGIMNTAWSDLSETNEIPNQYVRPTNKEDVNLQEEDNHDITHPNGFNNDESNHSPEIPIIDESLEETGGNLQKQGNDDITSPNGCNNEESKFTTQNRNVEKLPEVNSSENSDNFKKEGNDDPTLLNGSKNEDSKQNRSIEKPTEVNSSEISGDLKEDNKDQTPFNGSKNEDSKQNRSIEKPPEVNSSVKDSDEKTNLSELVTGKINPSPQESNNKDSSEENPSENSDNFKKEGNDDPTPQNGSENEESKLSPGNKNELNSQNDEKLQNNDDGTIPSNGSENGKPNVLPEHLNNNASSE